MLPESEGMDSRPGSTTITCGPLGNNASSGPASVSAILNEDNFPPTC